MGSADDFWPDASVIERTMGVIPIVEVLVDMRLRIIWEYITLHHNSVVEYISTRPIFGIVVAEERRPGSLVIILWC